MTDHSARQKIGKARAQLLINQPFFGGLALRLQLEEAAGLGTMGVDGRKIYYDPEFVHKLRGDELQFVVAHEVMHCALQHVTRTNGRDHGKFNRAGDYAINPILKDAGLTMPKDGLIDPQYAGKSADEIYTLLPDEQQGGGNNFGGCGEFVKAKGEDGQSTASPAEAKQLENNWKAATAQAAQQARKAGKLPGSLDHLVEGLLSPKIDWKAALRMFIQITTDNNDSTWCPPNRRFAHRGLYLPSHRSTKLPHLVVAFDTSGSVSDKELQAFVSELNSILDESPTRLTQIMCDSEIQSVKEYTPYDLPLDGVECKGRGGTWFKPVTDYVQDMDEAPAALIYATDGFPCDTPEDPGVPTIFVTTQNEDFASFGDVIKIEV